jgi:hypothetical protein
LCPRSANQRAICAWLLPALRSAALMSAGCME